MDAKPRRHWDVRLAVAMIVIAVMVTIVFTALVLADLESVRNHLGDDAWRVAWPAA
jgi:hypothetical protein